MTEHLIKLNESQELYLRECMLGCIQASLEEDEEDTTVSKEDLKDLEKQLKELLK